MTSNNSNINIFISYSHGDKIFLDKLCVHLKPLERKYTINIWHSGKIEPGAESDKEIKNNLNQANIILLLASAQAIASNDFYDILQKSLKLSNNSKIPVMGVLLSPFDWENTALKESQLLPRNKKPITHWENQEDAFLDITKEVEICLRNLLGEENVGNLYKKIESKNIILVPYKEKFHYQLNPKNQSPYNFHNPFIGRKKEVEILKAFLLEDDKSVISIIGPGGYGKTRLIIYLFQYIEKNNSLKWNCYTLLRQKEFDSVEFRNFLRGSNDKFLILVDDAHEFSNLEDVISIGGLSEFRGRVKVVLTTRTPLFNKIKLKFPIHEMLNKDVSVEPLDLEDAYIAFFCLLGDEEYKPSQLKYFAKQSGGVPLAITVLSHTIKKTGSSSGVFKNKELNFKEIAEKYIDEIIKDVKKETGLKSKKIKQALWILSLISPFTLENEGAIISGFLKINRSKLKELLNALLDNYLLQEAHNQIMTAYYLEDPSFLVLNEEPFKEKTWGMYPILKYSVKPDSFSDYIVNWFSDDKKMLDKLLEQKDTGRFIVNIIQNLFEASKVNDENSKVANEVLELYLKNFIEGKNNDKLPYWKALIDLGERLSYLTPNLSLDIVDAFIQVLEDKRHPIHSSYNKNNGKENFFESFKSKITSIIAQLAVYADFIPIVFDGAYWLDKYGEGNFVESCFRIKDFDLQSRGKLPPLGRQAIVFKQILGSSLDMGEQQKLILKLAPEFLKAELKGAVNIGDEGKLGTFISTDLYLPNHDSVHQFRQDLILILIFYFKKNEDQKIRREILDILMKSLVGIISRDNSWLTIYKKREAYEGDVEIKQILDFFIELASEDYGFYYRAILKKEGFEGYTVKSEHLKKKVDILHYKLKNDDSIGKKLALLFYTRRGFSQHEEQCQRLIKSYENTDEVIKDILKYKLYDEQFDNNGYDRGVYYLISNIGEYSDLSVEVLYSKLYEEDQKLTIADATYWLSKIYFHQKGSKTYFRERISILSRLGTKEALYSILHTYYIGIIWDKKGNVIEEDDYVVLKKIFSEFSSLSDYEREDSIERQIYLDLNGLLPELVKINKTEFLPYLIDYLSNTNHRAAETIIYNFFNNGEEFDELFVNELLFKFTPNLDIYKPVYSRFFNLIDLYFQKEGISWLLNFISQRLKIRKDNDIDYRGVFHKIFMEESIFIKDTGRDNLDFWKNEGNQIIIFNEVFQWYKEWEVGDNIYLIEDPWNLLRFFLPEKNSVELTTSKISNWLKMKQDINSVFKICLIITLFTRNIDSFQNIIHEISEILNQNYSNKVGKGDITKYDIAGEPEALIQLARLILRFKEKPFIKNKKRMAIFLEDNLRNQLGIYLND